MSRWHNHHLNSPAHTLPATTPNWRPALVNGAIPLKIYSGTVLETKVNHIHADRRGLVSYKTESAGGVANPSPLLSHFR